MDIETLRPQLPAQSSIDASIIITLSMSGLYT